MKKLNVIKAVFTVFILCLSFSFNVSAQKKWIIHKIGGRSTIAGMKYNDVKETINDNIGKIVCRGKGNILGNWTTPPKIAKGSVTSKEIEHFVAKQIKNGKNIGDIDYHKKVHVTWEYKPNTKDLKIVIEET